MQRKDGPAAYLTQEDCVIGWLCLIHIKEFDWLPTSLFNPCNSNPGRIVNKVTTLDKILQNFLASV